MIVIPSPTLYGQQIDIKNFNEPILSFPKGLLEKLDSNKRLKERLLKNHQNFVSGMIESLKQENERAKAKKPKLEKAKPLSYDERLGVNLLAFISTCTSIDLKYRAFRMLQHFSQRRNQNFDIQLYTNVLHAYAAEHDWPKVHAVCLMLQQNGIAFTPQVYAAICECIGRSPATTENQKILRRYVDQAAAQQITLNDILDKSQFVVDQREMVFAALKRIQPDFQPKYTEPELNYVNPMLKRLNRHIAPVENEVNNVSDFHSN